MQNNEFLFRPDANNAWMWHNVKFSRMKCYISSKKIFDFKRILDYYTDMAPLNSPFLKPFL